MGAQKPSHQPSLPPTLPATHPSWWWLTGLDRAVEEGSWSTVYVGVTPRVDLLRDDPRYRAILDRISLGHLRERFDSLAAARPWGGV